MPETIDKADLRLLRRVARRNGHMDTSRLKIRKGLQRLEEQGFVRQMRIGSPETYWEVLSGGRFTLEKARQSHEIR